MQINELFLGILIGMLSLTSQEGLKDALERKDSESPHKARGEVLTLDHGPVLSGRSHFYESVVPGLAFGSAAFLLGGVIGPKFHHHFKKGRPVVKYVHAPPRPYYPIPPVYAHPHPYGYGYSLPQTYTPALGWDSPYYYHTHYHY